MSATFYERACKFGAYATNGGALDLDAMGIALGLYVFNKADQATIAAQATIGPPSALTTPQLAELTTLLATAPSKNMLTPYSAFANATWAIKVMNMLRAGRALLPGFTTEALVKTNLGV